MSGDQLQHRPPAELVILSVEIDSEIERGDELGYQALDHYRRAGELLIEAKQAVTHGEWSDWLAANVRRASERSAQRYMRLAKHWPELQAKAPSVADLSLGAAEALLATPKPELPAPTRDSFLGTVEKARAQGERRPWPTEADVDAFCDVLASLREIRDGDLYRETHATFEDYCRDRWNIPTELLTLVTLDPKHASEEQRYLTRLKLQKARERGPELLANLKAGEMLHCHFATSAAVVDGVVYPNVDQDGRRYFHIARTVLTSDEVNSFVEGTKRGVRGDYVDMYLTRFCDLPGLDSGEWWHHDDDDFARKLHGMVKNVDAVTRADLAYQHVGGRP